MAVKRNKSNEESQEAEPEKNLEPMEMPKTLIAMRPILYLAKQYKAGERLPVSNQKMVEAWIEAGSAAWQEPGKKQFP